MLTVGQIDWTECPGIERRTKRMGGAWCFAGTRVTVASLFANLAGGATVDEYVKNFPDVAAARAIQVLNFLAHRLKAVWDPVAVGCVVDVGTSTGR